MLTHYIIVRRDLPLGVVAAMITHAAGESAHCYHGDEYNGRFDGARAVVLEVKNEKDLLKAEAKLKDNDIRYVVVRESSPPYEGSFMAIGLIPTDSESVAALLRPYQTLKSVWTDQEADVCTCTTCQAGVERAVGLDNPKRSA